MGSSSSKSHLPRNYWSEETGQVKDIDQAVALWEDYKRRKASTGQGR